MVEMWRAGCSRTYLLPPLSSGGALVVQPWLRFHIPLIEPDRPISRIRLSDKTSRLRFRVQRAGWRYRIGFRDAHQHANSPFVVGLLRARRERPHRRGAHERMNSRRLMST